MEFLSAPWWSALLAIILIDLVLAGDNAIVIALAARSLPPHLQKKAVVWGTVGAVVVRSAMTVGVVWLLKIPGLMLVGGIALLWIAYKLIGGNSGDDEDGHPAATTFWGAMKTIVIADAIMGVDNVLGVAGAAHGSFDLVVIGLLISIPIVVFGSTLVLKLVERFPSIMYLGAGVLAFTAGKMIVNEKLLEDIFKGPDTAHQVAYWSVCVLAIVAVLIAGWLANRHNNQNERHGQAA
jgi:YjbE family integral membrane protein